MQFSWIVSVFGVFTSVSRLKPYPESWILRSLSFSQQEAISEDKKRQALWGRPSLWEAENWLPFLAGLALGVWYSWPTLDQSAHATGQVFARVYPSFRSYQALGFLPLLGEEEPRVIAIFCYAFPQGSYTRGIDPNYANKLLIPVPKMADDGKRMRVKNQKWKLRTKVGCGGTWSPDSALPWRVWEMGPYRV